MGPGRGLPDRQPAQSLRRAGHRGRLRRHTAGRPADRPVPKEVAGSANTVLIGLVLAYEQAGTSAAFWPTYAFNALTVGLGEAVACYGLGGLLLWRLDKSNALQRYLQNR